MTDYSFLQTLEDTIKQQKQVDPKDSYTAKLWNEGMNKIAQKLGEESVEVVIAALNESNARFTSEVSDLLYHLFVLIEKKGVNISDIITEMERRNKDATQPSS